MESLVEPWPELWNETLFPPPAKPAYRSKARGRPAGSAGSARQTGRVGGIDRQPRPLLDRARREMESIDLTLAEEALGAIARKAIERKTGARGLRSIMEGILLDTMFDLPSLEGVEEVVISKEVVEGTARPLYIYADRSDRTADQGCEPAPHAQPLASAGAAARSSAFRRSARLRRNWNSAVMAIRIIGQAQEGTCELSELTSTPLTIGLRKS